MTEQLTRWPAYPIYKPSGLPWLGDLPAYWQTRRLKSVAPVSTIKLAEKPAESIYIGLEQIESGTGRLLLDTPVEQVDSAVGVFRKGDVLFGKLRPYLAKVVWAEFDGVCTSELLTLQPVAEADGRFLFYLLLSDGFISLVNSMTYGTKMPRASSEQIGNIAAPLPPLLEQHAIAAFLDRETARLDTMIAKKERLVELLDEKRAALISQAVTRGLEPTVPLKDSGVPWLGQIPAHWEAKRIRAIAESLQTGPFGSQLHSHEYTPGGVPVINPSHMKDGRVVPDWDCAVDDATWQRLSHHELHIGDIVFARRGEMGRCALVTATEAGWLCGTGSLRMRPLDGVVDSLYLNRVLSTKGVGDWLLLESVGTTMDNLNTKILANVPVPAPPLSEQSAIAAYLDREAAKLDALIAKVREGVEKLREYRAALIAAAVTGKIDVRAASGPPTDHDLRSG